MLGITSRNAGDDNIKGIISSNAELGTTLYEVTVSSLIQRISNQFLEYNNLQMYVQSTSVLLILVQHRENTVRFEGDIGTGYVSQR